MVMNGEIVAITDKEYCIKKLNEQSIKEKNNKNLIEEKILKLSTTYVTDGHFISKELLKLYTCIKTLKKYR